MGSAVRHARGLLELSGEWEAAQISLFHALEVFLWIEECTRVFNAARDYALTEICHSTKHVGVKFPH